MNGRRSLTAWLPLYSVAQRFLQVVDGSSYRQLKQMLDTIVEQRGTPQSTMSWSDPGKWIPERLTGDDKTLALRLWEESEHLVNPRYCGGLISLSSTHSLITHKDDTISLTNDGKRFIGNDEELLARMDDYDGMILILSEVANKGPARRRDFEERYAEFCRTFTTYAADSSISASLISRLNNLVDRRLVDKTGHTYQITESGLGYLRSARGEETGTDSTIEELVAANNAMARDKLVSFLQAMNPFLFEHLIKLLLEAMTYEDVEVTSQTNDKGVDVVAEIVVGITKVREVIQVKRQKNNVQRPTLDQLRGSLYRFNAVRGTIITTGGFTKGVKDEAFADGQPPITLIDGERLLDLLIENEIGVSKREIRTLEFDEKSLKQIEADLADEAAQAVP